MPETTIRTVPPFGPFVWLSLVFLSLAALPAAAGTFGQETFGGRVYWLFVPDGYQPGAPVPLVMMLHGCTQTGDGFATSAGMNLLADQEMFLVAYPQQPSSANSSQCWNWFETANQSRGSGEPALLAGVVGDIEASFSVDPDQVYVAGFSAGAAMAVILGATYPDVFAAIGVHSGLEYKAATSLTSAFPAMFSGGPPADSQGDLAYAAMGSRARVVPVMVFHGTSDFTVATVNGDLVLSQWAQTNDLASDGVDQDDIDDVAERTEGGQVSGGRTFVRSFYEDTNGTVVMEKILVDGMGHNWSGGPLGGTFTDPNGPDASRLLIDFFLAGEPPIDTAPPVTTANPPGGIFGATVAVTLSTNEAATTFYTVDGSTPDPQSPVYTGPLSIADDTSLRFFSVDSAGNSEAVRSESYVIDSAGDLIPPVVTASPEGGLYSEPVEVSLAPNEPATIYYTVDGSTPTTSSPAYFAPIALTQDTDLSFFGIDAAGNIGAIRTESYTFSAATVSMLPSIAAEDGYVGQLFVDGASATNHRLGDKGFFNTDTYRLILSFDTSGIPAGASITGATLTIYRASLSGSVPQLTADIADTVFGSSADLVRSDYSAAATLFGAFTLGVPATDGSSVSVSLPASVLASIVGPRFQIRLRATTPIDFGSDVLTLYGGEDAGLAPVLAVTYE